MILDQNTITFNSIKMFPLVIACALIATINADQFSSSSNFVFPYGRIVGGENTNIESHPYQISLQKFGSHTCGGSIISENYVVTAGHCVQGSTGSYLTVRAGSSFRTTGGSIHQVESVKVHENYKTNPNGIPVNDVAVLKINPPFKLDKTTQPIKLFDEGQPSKAGAAAIITGWGSTGTGLGLPNLLQKVTIPIVSKDLCDKAYENYGGVPKGQICAAYYGQGGKDSCQGDSGGPLTINGKLAGIVSWGNGCAQAYYPGVYTEVASFRDWIRTKTSV